MWKNKQTKITTASEYIHGHALWKWKTALGKKNQASWHLKWFICVLTVCWFMESFSFDTGDKTIQKSRLCGWTVWFDSQLQSRKLQPWRHVFITYQLYGRVRSTWCVMEHASSQFQNTTWWFQQSRRHDTRREWWAGLWFRIFHLRLNISLALLLWRPLVLPNHTEVSSSTVHTEEARRSRAGFTRAGNQTLNCFANCGAAWINRQSMNLAEEKSEGFFSWKLLLRVEANVSWWLDPDVPLVHC